MLDRKETVENLARGSQCREVVCTKRRAGTNRALMRPSAESVSLWAGGEQEVSLEACRIEANPR